MKNTLSDWAGAVLAVLVAGLSCTTAGAAAPPPVAVVEDVKGPVAGVEFMDYVNAGQTIALGPKGVLVLGYMASCWRETITGGTVTVGTEQSTVRQGRIERQKVPCDSSRMRLNPRESSQSAATVFRGLAGAPGEPVVVHGRSPVIDVGSIRGQLSIQRLDVAAEHWDLALDETTLLRGRFVDLARTPIRLEPGARYQARVGLLKVEFKVDWAAVPGAAPLVGRLVRLE